jgi:glycolate oxidase FAD binding subunit
LVEKQLDSIISNVRAAVDKSEPLRIVGSDSKGFYSGVVSYEPTELVVTARCGTPLNELQTLLEQERQCLAFEPPQFGSAGTVGGAVATGLSGPARPYCGALRDAVLGIRCVNGRGQLLSFGGQVMKNVDVSRLLVGSLGTLAVIAEVSFKVLPKSEAEQTQILESDTEQAIHLFTRWSGKPVPLLGACYYDGRAYLRLAGTAAGVAAAARQIGGDTLTESGFWTALRDHELAFFQSELPLWRLLVPAATPPLALPGDCLIDWGGGQRWLLTKADPAMVRGVVENLQGYAECFRGGGCEAGFMPVSAALIGLHRRLKTSFDPHGVLNPGRMYEDL